MKTVLEFCVRHGHQDFFEAWVEDGSGTAMHCPRCCPELFAELTAIDAALARKQEAAKVVERSVANLVRSVREILARGYEYPITDRNTLKLALQAHDEAVAELESL